MAKKKKKKHALWFEDPYESLVKMEDNIHRMMTDVWNRPHIRKRECLFPRLRFPKNFVKTIPVNIIDAGLDLVLRAELPGFKKDEIKLKVTKSSVDITAEKKGGSIEKEKEYFRQERSYKAARRLVPLPVDIKIEGVRAKFKNGILEIIMPKKEAPKKKEEKEVSIQ